MVVKREGMDEWRFQLAASLSAVDPLFGEKSKNNTIFADRSTNKRGGQDSLSHRVLRRRGLHREQACALDHGKRKAVTDERRSENLMLSTGNAHLHLNSAGSDAE